MTDQAPAHFPRAAFDRRRSPRGQDERRGEPLPSVNPWANIETAIDLHLGGELDLLGAAWTRLSPLARMCLWADHRNRMGPSVWRIASGLDLTIPPSDLEVLVIEAKGRLAELVHAQRFPVAPTTPKE